MKFLFLLAASLTISTSATAAQECNQNLPFTTNSSDFLNNGDQTITDLSTNLMWSSCLFGQQGSDCSSGSAISVTWAEALTKADKSNLANYSDWRLPNIKELASITEIKCRNPALNSDIFSFNDSSVSNNNVWSSSPVSDSTYFASTIDNGPSNSDFDNEAYFVNFNIGNIDTKFRNTDGGYIRLVRTVKKNN